MISDQRCETCKFFDRVQRFCRRYSPKAIAQSFSSSQAMRSDAVSEDGKIALHLNFPTNTVSQATITVWPSVNAGDWCGQWRATSAHDQTREMLQASEPQVMGNTQRGVGTGGGSITSSGTPGGRGVVVATAGGIPTVTRR